jgi:hypothetical protein
LAFIAAREPWRSTIAGQLSGEDVDAVTSLLGAVPIVKDHRVKGATFVKCTTIMIAELAVIRGLGASFN